MFHLDNLFARLSGNLELQAQRHNKVGICKNDIVRDLCIKILEIYREKVSVCYVQFSQTGPTCGQLGQMLSSSSLRPVDPPPSLAIAPPAATSARAVLQRCGVSSCEVTNNGWSSKSRDRMEIFIFTSSWHKW